MSLNFSHIQGDTFEAVNFEVIKNGDALDLTGAVIRMQLRKECGGIPILSFTSVASAGLTITNAASGLFKINRQIINISEFNYLYDIEITFSDQTVKTWISGSFLVQCDITR
jgi:hypothetical protein